MIVPMFMRDDVFEATLILYIYIEFVSFRFIPIWYDLEDEIDFEVCIVETP